MEQTVASANIVRNCAVLKKQNTTRIHWKIHIKKHQQNNENSNDAPCHNPENKNTRQNNIGAVDNIIQVKK